MKKDTVFFNVDLLKDPTFISATSLERGVWQSVAWWALASGNGSRIKGCRKWKGKMWNQLCAVTLRDIKFCKVLLKWEGDDLLLWGSEYLTTEGEK